MTINKFIIAFLLSLFANSLYALQSGSGGGGGTGDASLTADQTFAGANTFSKMVTVSSSVYANDYQTTQSATQTGENRYYELSGNGNNYIAITASASVSTDTTFKIAGDGSAGASLLTSGNGDLYWSNKVIDVYDYAVAISTPYSLGTNAICISPFRNYAVTITTITASVSAGTNMVFMVEQRPDTAPNSSGTNIWTGNVTALTTWTGGTVSDFTVPANSALYLKPTSVSGDVPAFTIKYRITRD